MAIKTKPAAFVASDGKEFESRKEAVAHDALVEAVRNFEEAKKQLGRAAAQSCKTADGLLFDFTKPGDYWALFRFGALGPKLARVSFWYSTEVVLSGPDNDAIALSIEENGREINYLLSDLYAEQSNGRRALAAAIREHIREKEKELAKLEPEAPG
jgi:hypothetical protein